MPLLHLDRTRSPFTGLTRATWQGMAEALLRNALSYAPRGAGSLLFAAPPHVLRRGADRYVGPPGDYVEDFARSLLLAAPLLARRPDLVLDGEPVAARFRAWLLRGVDPALPTWFGGPEGGTPAHHIIEAGTVAVCLLEAPVALWDPLTSGERELVCQWFAKCQAAPTHPNNWRWFNVLLDVFLRRVGAASDHARAREHLAAIRAMHADAGWFRDGHRFDFYSAWAMQFYPILWAQWEPDPPPGLVAEFYARNDAFLETYPHVFSRRGQMPAWGRSIPYRFAATAPLSVAFRRPSPPAIDPGFARRLCSGNFLQFVEHPGFLQHGLPSLGFYGPDARHTDKYLSTSSPLWCAKAFWVLSLPDDITFWSATENEGFWTSPPARVEFGTTGLAVEHDAASGHTRLFPPDSSNATNDARYGVVDTRAAANESAHGD